MTREDYIGRLKGFALDGALLLDAVFSELLDGKRDFSKLSVADLIRLSELGFKAWNLSPNGKEAASECIEHSPNC